MKVKELMTDKPVVIEVPGNSRADLLKLLIKKNLTGVPVVKATDGTIAGFVTRQDLFNKPHEEQLALLMNREYPVIDPDADAVDAARIMVDMDIHHLPVVKNEKLVGIITPTDLLPVVEKLQIKTPVGEAITKTCVPIFEGAPLNVALITFNLAKVTALPVLNEAGRLSGILSDRDLFNVSGIKKIIKESNLGIGDDEDAWTWEGLKNVVPLWYELAEIDFPDVMVKEIMVPEPKTVFEGTPVFEAAKIMKEGDYGQLPVVNSKNRLQAMLFELDVIRTLYM